MENGFQDTFAFKVIYIFTIHDDPHKGMLKIGDATLCTKTPVDQLTPNSHELNQAARERIKKYTNTAGVTTDLLYTELALRTIKDENGSVSFSAFRDKNVQQILKNSGIPNKTIGNTTGNEWFEVDLETAKKAILAVKQDYHNLSHTDVKDTHTPIVLLPDQEICVNRALKHLKKSDRFLINAKMRFGKTLTTLEIIKRAGYKKTIIMTHRPVVDSGWYEEFQNVFYGHDDIIYGSKATGYTVDQLLHTGKKFIYFASIQDLRGSSAVNGRFDKNDTVFNTVWDCMIVDEAHEGTTTALGEETVKAVFKEGSGTKFIALSGTPFNILDEYDDDSIYTYDYIKEQENKSEWDKLHFGDHNPYDELPELHIYTYDLGDILHNSNYITFEDKAFNFREFFRTFTGDFKKDFADMPDNADIGDFVHEDDILSFLNLMTKEGTDSNYPYSTKEYRNLFRHSLWMIPGVKEARALKKLMLNHPVFGNGQFEIINVAGEGDEEEKSEDALAAVKSAIKDAKATDGYTITLSCGRLTTGVTVKEWTAVFMLAGSYSTSAANYLQTIFRVQSPCNENGKIKENAYVFDFAPDRTLKMISSAVHVSARAGKTSDGDREIMGKFLNYCPVISVSGSEMKEYSTGKLLQQLKRAYADKVVRNGFDDSNLYNDNLLTLDQLDIKKFDELRGIIGTSKASQKTNDITVNDQGLTNEEHEKEEKLKKKKKKELTPEEKAFLEEMKKKKKVRSDAISILRGISIRMPLLIYGADIPYDEEITLDKFIDVVDDPSWNEFMPKGVTKEKFKEFQKYYDEEVFVAAGRRIRNISREADTLEPTERVKKIAGLFSHFKNPDKETVLTPWRVVNLHMSDCLGGWCFYDKTFEEDHSLEEPRFVDRDKVTADTFGNTNARILEINSKTGLYPLYVAYSLYRTRLQSQSNKDLTINDMRDIWFKCVQDNVYVICKTPMAKAITKRTLVGYSDKEINAHHFKDLINTMQNKPMLFVKRVTKCGYWKKGDGEMKFDAVVGNPPYQETIGDDSNASLSKQLFPYFIMTSITLQPEYISLITPARWFTGDAQDKSFLKLRVFLREHNCFEKMFYYKNEKDIFSSVEIKGGIQYFLWHKGHTGKVLFTTHDNGNQSSIERNLFEDGLDVVISDVRMLQILYKVKNDNFISIVNITKGRNAFGIIGKDDVVNKISQETSFDGACELRCKSDTIRYITKDKVTKNIDVFEHYKVFISKSAGNPNSDQKVIGKAYVGDPYSACTDSLIPIGCFNNREEAENLSKYLSTKFLRFMVQILKSSQNVTQTVYQFVPMQDFTNKSDINWSSTINDIDRQLYKKYLLSDDDINYIESAISPID